MTYSFRYFLACWTATVCLGGTAASPAAAQLPVKRAVNPPPPATLDYRIKAKQSGLSLEGNAVIQWHANRTSYKLTTETRSTLVGKILETGSEGGIDSHGLSPTLFTEKKFRKKPETATFDRNAKQIVFSRNGETQPLAGGEQDRSSVVWQLAAMARAAPAQVKNGAAWTLVVAGPRDAEPWTFRVIGRETIRTPGGSYNAVRIDRMPPDDRGQKVAIWLAPSLEWYPVQLRFTDSDGDLIEQALVKVTRSPS